jgi:secreted trypsin-like serine protease
MRTSTRHTLALTATATAPNTNNNTNNNRYSCGASLVTDQLVVSAAHCYASMSGSGGLHSWVSIRARVGTETVYEERNVTCVKLHENYSPFTYANDIAMLKLESPISAAYTPVELATSDVSTAGSDFLIAGWGTTSQQSADDDAVVQTEASVLQIAVTSTITKEECLAVYVTSTHTQTLSHSRTCICLTARERA